MRRAIVVALSVIALTGLGVSCGGAAWGAPDRSSTAVITFEDAAHQVQLTIPTPACPTSQPDCTWKFFLNEPKLSVDVAIVYGTSGTLTLAYPQDFCGVIQADAYVGPPWVAKRGFQHTIADCTTPTPTPTPTPTTPVPPVATTTTSTDAPPVSGSADANSAPPPSAAPAASPPSAPGSAPGSAPASHSTSAQAAAPASAPLGHLPFTGMSITPFLVIGLTLVMLGLSLLIATGSWRRMVSRLAAAVHRH